MNTLNKIWNIYFLKLEFYFFFLCQFIFVLVSCYPFDISLFAPLERWSFDTISSMAPRSGDNKVVVINLDYKSMNELGILGSFEYKNYAVLLDKLHAASSVALNLDFTVPMVNDSLLVDAIRHHGRVVVSVPSPAISTSPFAFKIINAAAGVGHREFTVGDHLVVTGFIPYQFRGDYKLDHVAIEAIHVAGLCPQKGHLYENNPAKLSLIKQMVGNKVLLSLHNIDLEEYSFVDVLKNRVPESVFLGKIVFVGLHELESFGYFYRSIFSTQEDSLTSNQVNALIAETLLVGGGLTKVPDHWQILIGLFFCIWMVWICKRARYRDHRLWLLAWISSLGVLFVGLFLVCQLWLPISSMVIGCLIIYTSFTWRRLIFTIRHLKQGLVVMRQSSFLPNVEAELQAEKEVAAHDDIEQMLQQIRLWQDSCASVINLLPYPIFIEQDGRVVLSNSEGTQMLTMNGVEADGSVLADLLKQSANSRVWSEQNSDISISEVTINERGYMLLASPFDPLSTIDKPASLISFVDVHGIKEAISHDRNVLRQLAHDLRNPWVTILAMVEQEERGLIQQGENPFLDSLRQMANYSLRVSQDFMQLSRAQHLNANSFFIFSLNDLVPEAVDQIYILAQQKKIQIVESLDYSELWVNGHHNMLLRALVNVLENAVKYSLEGATISIAIELNNEFACVRVQDEGIGIPPEAIPRLFELFFQVGTRQKKEEAGVGLGLPFVKSVIESHGGYIEVASEVGKGSLFCLFLPICSGPCHDDSVIPPTKPAHF